MPDWVTIVAQLEAGDWESPHRVVQQHDSRLACWAHGIVHLMEGDEANAAYWYRRAGRTLPAATRGRVEAEIAELRVTVLAEY